MERANVDWYFFNNDYETSYDNTVAYKAGHYYKGDTVDYGAGENQLPDFRGNDKDGPAAHCNLRAYLSLVTNALDIASAAYKQYDYIVFEFDSYRLAEKYNSGNANWDELEKTAARCLKKFYDQNRVLWIVDKGKSGEDPLVGNDKWYTPSSYRRTDAKYGGKMSDRQWMGVLALLDPGTYMTNNVPYVRQEGGYKYANRIESQVNYEQSEEVTKAIADHMVLPTYDARVEDNVITVGGLVTLSNGVESVKVYQWNGAEAPVQDKDAGKWYADGTEWGPMTDSTCDVVVNPDENGIKAVVSNLNGSVWCKLEIAISTKEGFNEKAIEEAEKAEKDPEYKKTAWCVKSDGQYMINPNKGNAQLTLFRSRNGKTEVTCAAQAASLSQWWLVDLERRFFVGSEDAEKPYDGLGTNIVIGVATNASGVVVTPTGRWYRNMGKTGEDTWIPYDPAAGYTNVVDSTHVEFKVSVDGYVDFIGTNTVTITPAPITVIPPGGTPPEEPFDPTKPWIQAVSVTNVYNGAGTNIVYRWGNIIGEPTSADFGYGIEDPTVWEEYDNIFTNVMYDAEGKVRATNAWFRLCFTDGQNYKTATAQAEVYIVCVAGETNILELTVTDTNRWDSEKWKRYANVTNEIAGAAPEKDDVSRYNYDALDLSLATLNWKYETPDDVTTNFEIGVSNEDMQTLHIPYEFKDADKLDRYEIWRYSEAYGVEKLTEGDSEDEGFTVDWDRGEIVFRMKKASQLVIMTYYAQTPLLTGRMQWKYQQADNSFWAALDVVCTNGDPTAIRNLCYVYEDRADCYLRNPAPMSTQKLSATSSETYGGKTFGKAVLDEGFIDSLRMASLCTTNRYGVSDETLASSNDRVQTLAEMRVALYMRNRITLVRQAKEAVENSLGYLTWQENGRETVYWCPLGENLPPLPVDGYENSLRSAPLTVAMYNASVGYGLPAVTLDSDPSLAIDEFDVSDGRINGRVVTVSGNVRGIPGPNARLTMLGSATVGGRFVEVGCPELDGEGRFSMDLPVGVTFFRVRLSLVNVVK